jgi:hypothetical protein
MTLFGIWGSHTTESWPLNNVNSRRVVLSAPADMEQYVKKYRINRILAQFHSALEHTFLWVVDAEDPHLIENFLIDAGVASFNAVKIVPMITFKDVFEKCKAIGA